MAVTTVAANNRGIKFLKEVIREFVRGDMFKPYKSESPTAIIRVLSLKGKYGGDQINVPIVGALSGTGVGSGPLEGNEEKIDNYGFRLWIDWWRNAVRATKAEIKKGSFDLFGQAAPLVSEQAKRIQRDETVVGMLAIPSESMPTQLGSDLGRRVNGILWTGNAAPAAWANEATPTQRNAWLSANPDRVLFGQAFSNTVAGNVASSLANVSVGTGKLSAKTIRIAKAKAKKTTPRIEPVTTDDGYERFVMFVGSIGFRDLYADPEIYAANKDARPREGSNYLKNPIFNDGDLLYNGVIIREVPEIDILLTQVGVGASGANVVPAFLCGRNAMAWVVSEEMEPTTLDDTDYQFHKGAGIEMAYGLGKIAKKSADGTRLIDWGVFTIFHNSTDDA